MSSASPRRYVLTSWTVSAALVEVVTGFYSRVIRGTSRCWSGCRFLTRHGWRQSRSISQTVCCSRPNRVERRLPHSQVSSLRFKLDSRPRRRSAGIRTGAGLGLLANVINQVSGDRTGRSRSLSCRLHGCRPQAITFRLQLVVGAGASISLFFMSGPFHTAPPLTGSRSLLYRGAACRNVVPHHQPLSHRTPESPDLG